jgi:hypothetical protein
VKALIALMILLAAFWVVKQLSDRYQQIERGGSPGHSQPTATVLPGLPPSLEPSLEAARQKGAAGLRSWLINYQVHVRDPRLAAIQLDYVVLLSHQDPVEARRIFREVQKRTPPSSPVYERIKRLEKAFQ